MIKRDMENPTKYAAEIKHELKIQDLQGLCKDQEGKYTMAVEAIYMGDDPVDTFREAFERGELYAKACLAEHLNIDCVVMLHNEEGALNEKGKMYKDPKTDKWVMEDKIYVHYLKPDHVRQDARIDHTEVYKEDEFLTWWRLRKVGWQSKGYRKEMRLRIKSSYFDGLLENNETSWSGILMAS